MSNNPTINQLKEDGWNIKQEALEEFNKNLPSGKYNDLVKHFLNTDLKDVGCSTIPPDLKGKNKQSFPTPLVLQITNVRNISAPKGNPDSGAAPRMLRITLTDGIGFVNGIELKTIKGLSGNISPGTKLKLLNKVEVSGSHLMLMPSNTEFLGGKVEQLHEKWKLSQSVSKHSRSAPQSNGSGPPPWISFGQKIVVANQSNSNFQSLAESTAKTKVDDEFQQQRNQAVAELAKATTQKVFGGGKHMLDTNVQRVVNAGYTIEEAEWALKCSRNDPGKAIRDLRMGTVGKRTYDPIDGAESAAASTSSSSRGGRRGRGRGRGGRDRDRGPDDSDEDIPMKGRMRPSGPASLSDFLESKMLQKKESFAQVEEKKDSFRGRKPRGRFAPQTNLERAPDLTNVSWPVVGETPDPAQNKGARSLPLGGHSIDTDRGSYQEADYSGYNSMPYNSYKQQQSRYSGTTDTYNQQSNRYSQNRYNRGYDTYNQGQNKYNQGRDRYNQGQDKYNQGKGRDRYDQGQDRYYQGKDRYDQGQDKNNQGQDTYNQGQDKYNQGQDKYNQGQDKYNQGQDKYNQGQDKYNQGQDKYKQGQEIYNQGQEIYNQGHNKYNRGQARYNQGWNNRGGQDRYNYSYSDPYTDYNTGYNETDYSHKKPDQMFYNARGHGAEGDSQTPSGYGNEDKSSASKPARSYSAKEKELIAEFQKSMIQSGHYESENFQQDEEPYGGYQSSEHGGYYSGNYNNRRASNRRPRRGRY